MYLFLVLHPQTLLWNVCLGFALLLFELPFEVGDVLFEVCQMCLGFPGGLRHGEALPLDEILHPYIKQHLPLP